MQLVIPGPVIGSITAIGLSMIYKTLNFVNAHGDFVALWYLP